MAQKNEMTVDELREALMYMDGRRIVKVYGNGSMDDDIVEVHEDEVNEDRKVATVTIVTAFANHQLRELLMAFFDNCLPIEAPGYSKLTYTTEEIIDALDPMMTVQKDDLIKYMSNNGYKIQKQLDGIPKWVVYTIIRP